MTLIWGRHPVHEALRAGRAVDRIYLAAGVRASGVLDAIARLSLDAGVHVQRVDRRALDRMSDGAAHQGVIAEVAEFRYAELADLLMQPTKTQAKDRPIDHSGKLPLLLVLDALEDPQNFGTLIRTADAIAATGVIVPLHRAVGVTPSVAKASAGAVEFVRIARVTNLSRALIAMKAAGFWVVGLDAAGSEHYSNFSVDVPVALVVGAEGKGLGRLIKDSCDTLVRIPMYGHVESLNAGVAASIVLFDIIRRRATGPQLVKTQLRPGLTSGSL